jgi:hypothetical protein
MKRRLAIGVASVLFCLGGLVFVTAGAATKTVNASGGAVTFSATVRGANTCTWSSKPKIAGFVATVRCKTGAVARTAMFKANASTRTKSFAITLTAHGKTKSTDHWMVIQAGQSATTTTTVPPTTTTTTGESPAPIELSGTGQMATSAFTVEDGLAVFQASCSTCQTNFIMEVDQLDGTPLDTPINVTGAYSGSVAEAMSAGQYFLSVTADPGVPWSVEVTQPRGVVGVTPPTTFSGESQDVVGPVAGGANLWISAMNTSTHGGNFIVKILGANGSLQGEPIDVVGSYSGSTIANFLSGGPYYLEINSDGAWSVTVSSG